MAKLLVCGRTYQHNNQVICPARPKRGDVISILNDNVFVGRIPQMTPWWRVLALPGVQVERVMFLLERDPIPGIFTHFRRWSLLLDVIEREATRKRRKTLADDDEIEVSVAQIELLKVVKLPIADRRILG